MELFNLQRSWSQDALIRCRPTPSGVTSILPGDTWMHTGKFCLVVTFLTNHSQGLSVKQAEFAVKKYKSHRRIPASIMMDLEIMNI